MNPAKHATYVPHTAGRYSVKRFRKSQCPIVERLTNSLMMHGRNNGKKLMAVRIVKHAMEIIHLLTDQNPIQVIVDAVINRYPNLIYVIWMFFCKNKVFKDWFYFDGPWDTVFELFSGSKTSKLGRMILFSCFQQICLKAIQFY